MRANPSTVLGLSTGRTPERVYALLAEHYRAGELDFSRVSTFNLDEYIGVPASDPRSYRGTMNSLLFSHINIDLKNTHIPNGMASDIDAECAHYESQITACGGIDLQLVGIGENGHLAFNEPLSSFSSRTRSKSLTPETRAQNAKFFGGADSVPSRSITMGVGTILESRWCIMLATGAAKAPIIQRAIEGPLTSMVTASALQLHKRCVAVLDEAAASRLEMQEYYRWVFANEPEWKGYQSFVRQP